MIKLNFENINFSENIMNLKMKYQFINILIYINLIYNLIIYRNYEINILFKYISSYFK